jgi:catechol 2,3-dioxygenase-like lactoylglutathione lyase family enzyme
VKVRGFNHLAIQTLDLEASILFYRDVLGFILEDSVDAGEFTSTNLVVPDGSFVELVSLHKPGPGRPGNIVDHIAFDVDDVEAAERALIQAGVEIVQPCTTLERFKSRVVKCRDPNGIILAFRQDWG